MEYSNDTVKMLLERERIGRLICAQLNNFIDLKPTLMKVITYIKELAGCEAVSIRLYDSGDYPYYVYIGFPDLFVKQENNICCLDENGNRIPSPDGKGYLLECMCGKIISGEFDPSLSFFTETGSFWSDYMSAIVDSISEEDRQKKTIAYCTACGYNSIALVPIKIKGERTGLVQLNDKKLGVFNKDLVEYMEMIAEQIGVTIQNSLAYTKRSTTDLLTNMLNRRGLFNAINIFAPLSKRNKSNIATMLIDIDHLRQINNSYGYQTGDYILKRVANIIKNNIRSSDIVARYGREEFLVFLSAVNSTALPSIAEKLRYCVEEQTKEDIPTTISIGAAEGMLKTDQKKEIYLLIRKANESLSRAKHSGSNRVFIGE